MAVAFKVRFSTVRGGDQLREVPWAPGEVHGTMASGGKRRPLKRVGGMVEPVPVSVRGGMKWIGRS
jgi:hypothetical protein